MLRRRATLTCARRSTDTRIIRSLGSSEERSAYGVCLQGVPRQAREGARGRHGCLPARTSSRTSQCCPRVRRRASLLRTGRSRSRVRWPSSRDGPGSPSEPFRATRLGPTSTVSRNGRNWTRRGRYAAWQLPASRMAVRRMSCQPSRSPSVVSSSGLGCLLRCADAVLPSALRKIQRDRVRVEGLQELASAPSRVWRSVFVRRTRRRSDRENGADHLLDGPHVRCRRGLGTPVSPTYEPPFKFTGHSQAGDGGGQGTLSFEPR